MFIKRQNQKRACDGVGQGKRALLMPYALNQPIALLPSLSFAHTHNIPLSVYLFLLSFTMAAPASQKRIDLWGRFDLPKGLSLGHPYLPPVYPSFPSLTTRTRATSSPSSL